MPLLTCIVFVMGLPGFLLLRFALKMARIVALPWFALAGMVNGSVVVLGFLGVSVTVPFQDYGNAAILALAIGTGALSGVVYRWVERALLPGREGAL